MLRLFTFRDALSAAIVFFLAIGWAFDHSRLSNKVANLERDLDAREMLQDKAEVALFDLLETGQSVGEHPNLQSLADDVIRPGHHGFDYCTTFLAEHFPEISGDFEDCEIVVYDVDVDAVPFRGGSYWIVTRNDCIVLTFPYVTIIGG